MGRISQPWSEADLENGRWAVGRVEGTAGGAPPIVGLHQARQTDEEEAGAVPARFSRRFAGVARAAEPGRTANPSFSHELGSLRRSLRSTSGAVRGAWKKARLSAAATLVASVEGAVPSPLHRLSRGGSQVRVAGGGS